MSLLVALMMTIFYHSITNFHEGRLTMAATILWETDMKKTMARARSENKLILLDFFDSG
jgi:hypothetical protein